MASLSLKNLLLTGVLLASSASSYAASYVTLSVPVPVPKLPPVATSPSPGTIPTNPFPPFPGSGPQPTFPNFPPVIRLPVLPASLYFMVDSRFSSAEQDRLRAVIASLLVDWENYYMERASSGYSSYEFCAYKYATKNLKPSGTTTQARTGAEAAYYSMERFTRQIRANGFNLAAPAIINYEVPTGSYFTIKSARATNPDKAPLTITVNPQALQRTDLSILVLTGSLHHAWLHRQGYIHPKTHTSSFISEASMCVMRNYAPKYPGSDAAYSAFLD